MVDYVDEEFDAIVNTFRQFAKNGNFEFKHQKYADGKQVVVVECWCKPRVDKEGRK